MSDDLTWLINGVDLDSDLGDGFLTSISSWRAPVTTRRNHIEVPGRHGVISPGIPIFDPPLVTLSVRVLAADQAAVEAMINNLVGLLTQPALTVTRISGGITTTAAAELVSIDDDDFLVANADRLTAVLTLPGVFLHEAAATGSPVTFTDLVSVEVPHLAGSTGPIGDAIVRVTGPAVQATITDAATGTGISWAGDLTAGQYLYLDAAHLTARISAADNAWTSGGTDASAGVSYPSAGRLQLWPIADTLTSRKVRFSATGSGRTGASAITIRAGRCFL